MATETTQHREVGEEQAWERVWDPFVRLFHWSLVLAFLVAWASGDELDKLHEVAGYVVAGLTVFRFAWGFVGTKHARFFDFVYRPSKVLAYIKDMARWRSRRYLGHNPAGGAMIIAMLVMLSVISATGIMLTTDAFWGVEWVEELHEIAVNLMLVLVGIHVIGVFIASIKQGENLVRAMITGRGRRQ